MIYGKCELNQVTITEMHLQMQRVVSVNKLQVENDTLCI